MNKVSLNLNNRTSSIPVFSTINELLNEYYNQFPIDNDNNYGLLYDTYSLMQELFDVIGSKYDNETKLLLSNYIYRLKGSPKALYELFRLLWGDNDDSLSGTPNYSIKYNYSVRGYNDIYKSSSRKELTSYKIGDPVDIIATSENPFVLYSPTIIPGESKITPWITNNEITGLINYESANNGEDSPVSESVDEEYDEWITDEDSTTEEIVDITITWSEYSINTNYETANYETEKKYSVTFKDSLTAKEKKYEKKIYYPGPEEDVNDWKHFSSKKETSQFPDGTYYNIITIVEVSTAETNSYKETTYVNENEQSVKYYKLETGTEGFDGDGENSIEYYTKNSSKYTFSSDTYTKKNMWKVEKTRNDLLTRTRPPQEEEEETVVDFDLYDDGSLKWKNTTQTAYDYTYKKVETKVYSIFNINEGNEINTVTERVLTKEPMIITRQYSFVQPQKKLFISGANLSVYFNDNGDLCVHEFDSLIKLIKNGKPPYENNIEDGTDTIELENLFNIEEIINKNLGDLYYKITPKIENEDTADSIEAQKCLWSTYDCNKSEANPIGRIKLKEKNIIEDDKIHIEKRGLQSQGQNEESQNKVLKSFVRPHVEIWVEDEGEDEQTNISYLCSGKITEAFDSNPIKYSDAREIVISISNISVLDYNKFTYILKELTRDLLLVSTYGNTNEDLDAISIKVDLVNYYIDSNINLKKIGKVRQINNIVPYQYVTEGKLLWTSPYLHQKQ